MPSKMMPPRQRFTRVTRGTIAPDAKVVATLPGAAVRTPDDFTNFEGDGYLRGGHSTWNNAPQAGEPRIWQTLNGVNTNSVEAPRLLLDLAASGDPEAGVGPYEDPVLDPENSDFIRLLTDDNDDGEFDLLAEFAAVEEFETDFPGFLHSADGIVLTPEFQTFTFNLPQADALDLRIEVFTNEGAERVGIDNLRVVGEGVMCNPTTMGDIDGSGDVAFLDFLILAENFGQTVSDHTLGDLDCDGTVAFLDFLILAENFGSTVGEAVSVPEPGLTSFLFPVVWLVARRRETRSARVLS